MLAAAHPRELARLRDLCRDAGYTEDGLIAVFGPAAIPVQLSDRLPHYLYLTREGRRLDTLIRLFLLGVATPRRAAAAALGEDLLDDCARWGLVEIRGESVVAGVRLTPFRGLLLAVDQPADPEIERLPDQVMGITGSTAVLANFTIRRPVRDTLDLGTGCGVQALLASRHSERVTATDCNRRALAFARFNAALNNQPNICFIEGDAFQPVRGRTFDLIVVNPPFAISPWPRYLYRDSGQPADQFCERLVRQAPAFLNEGGFFQMTLDWVERAGEDWKQRLCGWFEDSGCDAWVLRLDRETAASYAYLWIRDTEPDDRTETGRLYEEWVRYFERERIEAISTGVIAMRRRNGRNWVRVDEAPGGMQRPVGQWIALGFQLRDYLDATTDDDLLATRLRVAPQARLIEECEVQQQRWQSRAVRLQLAGGLPWEGRLDARLRGLLARMDGRHLLRDLLVHLAVEIGAAPQQVIAAALPLLRDLILRGFLLPEGAVAPDDELH